MERTDFTSQNFKNQNYKGWGASSPIEGTVLKLPRIQNWDTPILTCHLE
jgi:hypothetical protein